jgi:hypothetical protein
MEKVQWWCSLGCAFAGNVRYIDSGLYWCENGVFLGCPLVPLHSQACGHSLLQDGEVDAEELQRCLTQSGISGTYARETMFALVSSFLLHRRLG